MNTATLSLLFTLSLILISLAPLPTSSSSLYESLCDEAKEDKAKCLQVLKADPRIVGAQDNKKLCKFILELGLKKGIETQNYLKEVMKTKPSPAIKECATFLYDGVVGSFKSSMGEIKVDELTSNYDAQVASDGPITCDVALTKGKINDPSISAMNKEILLISKLAFLATNRLSQ